jgi:hypothetical protein
LFLGVGTVLPEAFDPGVEVAEVVRIHHTYRPAGDIGRCM